jgi:uncharacterized membrane protein YbhN (UPF0104 family)
LRYTRRARLPLATAGFFGAVAGVEYWIGWESVLAPWRQLRLHAMAVAALIVLLSYIVRTMRIVVFFEAEMRARFPAALRLMLMYNLWNTLLPTIGEVSFPILMQRYFIISATRSLPALLWFRLLDLYVLLLLATTSLMLDRNSWRPAALVVALLTLAIPVAYRWLPGTIGYLERKSNGTVKESLSEIRKALPGSRCLLLSSWWTLVNWALKLLVFAWVIQQFVSIGFGQSLLGAVGGELTSVLPVNTIAGAGTYEAGVVAALAPADVGHQEALKAAVNLHLFLLSCTLLSGFLSYLLPVTQISRANRLA